MQFRDLKKQYQTLKTEIDEAVLTVMSEGSFISGHQVVALEERLARHVGVKHCITCANGTDAIWLSLMAYGVGDGDAVFVPDFTFFASAEMPAAVGATPVFVDVDADTCNIDPERLEQAILRVKRTGKLRPRAIVAVDLFGQCADYNEIEAIAEKHSLILIEDAAQSFGACIGARRACSFGDIAATSFFPSKPLGCYGDGGAVFTNDDRAARLVRSYAVHGMGDNKYDNVRIGINSRLDTIQAAILSVKLDAFEKYELFNINRVADLYTDCLKNFVKTPSIKKGYYSSWAQYTIQLKNESQRFNVQSVLKTKEIPSMVYYPKSLHQQKAFETVFLYDKCPVADRLSQTVLSLPIHPYMTDEDVDTVVSVLQDYVNK